MRTCVIWLTTDSTPNKDRSYVDAAGCLPRGSKRTRLAGNVFAKSQSGPLARPMRRDDIANLLSRARGVTPRKVLVVSVSDQCSTTD